MENIIYKSLESKYYEDIKSLICEAFNFCDLIKDKKTLDNILNIYLQQCLLHSSYSQVAIKNDKVIGIILGDSKYKKSKIGKFKNMFILFKSFLKLLFCNKQDRFILNDFSKLQKTYKYLIKEKKNNFDGCIELFIVSKESRNLGIGKKLIHDLYSYMKDVNSKKIYVYTDNYCNYKFYENQNFELVNEKLIEINNKTISLNVLLYSHCL